MEKFAVTEYMVRQAHDIALQKGIPEFYQSEKRKARFIDMQKLVGDFVRIMNTAYRCQAKRIL